MRCIFCLLERPPSLEHVFPLAIGGCVTTDRVCAECNSELGTSVDKLLANHPLIELERATHNLAGNSGTVPDALRTLLGRNARLGESGQRVHVSGNAGGKPDFRLVPHEEVVTLEDGRTAKRLSIDAREASRIPTIIARQRTREALPPLTDDEMTATVDGVVAQKQAVDPTVRGELAIDGDQYRRAVLKIVYELSFLWFGDHFLDTPLAKRLREVIAGKGSLEESKLRGWIALRVIPPLNLWPAEPGHLAFSSQSNDRVAVCVRIFKTISAVVEVGSTEDLTSGQFVRNDILARVAEHTTLSVELRKRSRVLFKSALLQSSTTSLL